MESPVRHDPNPAFRDACRVYPEPPAMVGCDTGALASGGRASASWRSGGCERQPRRSSAEPVALIGHGGWRSSTVRRVNSDEVAVAIFVAGLVAFLAVFIGVVLFLVRRTKKRGGGRPTSSSESFNDILESVNNLD